MPHVRFLVARAGHRLAYVDEGRGPLLLLPTWCRRFVQCHLAISPSKYNDDARPIATYPAGHSTSAATPNARDGRVNSR